MANVIIVQFEGDLPGLDQRALALAVTSRSDKDPADALLLLDEVLGLKLNADRVVLSACNTAAADGKADEALSGLARGFFYAGSRSLLVTHWSVESESAKLLTSNTIAKYSANANERKAESLRQAILKVMAMRNTNTRRSGPLMHYSGMVAGRGRLPSLRFTASFARCCLQLLFD